MPYFEVKTNAELGRIVELIPGKSAGWVMTHLEDRTNLHFAGTPRSPPPWCSSAPWESLRQNTTTC